jgi:hypothetical protein
VGPRADAAPVPELEAEDCEASGLGGCAVRTAAPSRARLVRCTLADSGGFGLAIGGDAEARDAVLRRNARGGAAVEAGGRLAIVGGRVEGNGRRGVVVRTGAALEARDAAVEHNAGPGIEAVGAAALVLAGNRCHANRAAGILLGEGVRGEVRGNACAENGGDGIALLRGAHGWLAENVVRRNRRYGLWFGSGSEATLQANVAEANLGGEVMASWRAVVAHVDGTTPAGLARAGGPGVPPIRYAPVDRRVDRADRRLREPSTRPWPST